MRGFFLKSNGYLYLHILMRKITISSLKKKADKTFSEWIRKRDNYVCFTCGKKGDKSSMQNGHYISRSINILRYSELNCHCQCIGCNVFQHGNIPEYAIRLQQKYGEDILQTLHKKKQEFHQFKKEELEDIIQKYGS